MHIAATVCYSVPMHQIQISLSEIFQALADSTRLRIVRLLAAQDSEICPCEIVDSLQEPEYKISRHLKLLRSAGLISARREGKWIYHSLVRDEKYLKTLATVVLEFPDADATFKEDQKRFKKRLKIRNRGRCVTGATFQIENIDKSIVS